MDTHNRKNHVNENKMKNILRQFGRWNGALRGYYIDFDFD